VDDLMISFEIDIDLGSRKREEETLPMEVCKELKVAWLDNLRNLRKRSLYLYFCFYFLIYKLNYLFQIYANQNFTCMVLIVNIFVSERNSRGSPATIMAVHATPSRKV
jgi:hypothetical protein